MAILAQPYGAHAKRRRRRRRSSGHMGYVWGTQHVHPFDGATSLLGVAVLDIVVAVLGVPIIASVAISSRLQVI